MMDEVVGHMTEKVVIPPAGEIPYTPRKRPGLPPGDSEYLPYMPDDDMVPSMAHAGEGYAIHMTGLTHDERGYPALNAEAHEKLCNRLIDKIRLNAPKIVRHEDWMLEDAETVVVSFGCTSRSARQAVNLARRQGVRAGLLRPITMWPFPQDRIRELVAQGTVKQFVVPEINLGQMGREVERLTQLPVRRVNRAGGSMITPETILEAIVQ